MNFLYVTRCDIKFFKIWLTFFFKIRDIKDRPIKKSVQIQNSHFLPTSLNKNAKNEHLFIWSEISKEIEKQVKNFEFWKLRDLLAFFIFCPHDIALVGGFWQGKQSTNFLIGLSLLSLF